MFEPAGEIWEPGHVSALSAHTKRAESEKKRARNENGRGYTGKLQSGWGGRKTQGRRRGATGGRRGAGPAPPLRGPSPGTHSQRANDRAICTTGCIAWRRVAPHLKHPAAITPPRPARPAQPLFALNTRPRPHGSTPAALLRARGDAAASRCRYTNCAARAPISFSYSASLRRNLGHLLGHPAETRAPKLG